ncbi:MAG: RagB/SusD family nutrient uptake outer membrane protein [Tannerella sp.]|nr:RagB/SusD family nutrient uptake outer membrane protein [Tannerella sp.]
MKKFCKYAILSLCFLLPLLSCEDSLDKKPLTEISEADVWEDPALVNAFVNSRYNQVGVGWTESWQSSVVDETHLIWSRGCEPITQGYVSPSELGRMNGAWWGWDNRAWGTVWANISNCNLFFDKIDEVPFSNEDERTSLKGQVRFIRVLMYHDLISRWGAMPIITKAYTLNDVDEIMATERATYAECVDFMVSELDKAVSELPPNFSGADKGRATSIAALALKSRILLYAASDLMNVGVEDKHIGYLTPDPDRWKKAANAADTCIKQALENGYGLYDRYDNVKQNYTQLFLDGGNKEVIFDRQGTTSADGQAINTIDQTNGPNGYGLWGGNVPLQEFVDAFEMSDGSKFDWNNPTHKQNPYVNRDQRLYAYVLCEGDEWKGRQVECFIDADASGNELTSGGRDSKFSSVDAHNTSLSGYNMRKFMDESYAPNSWDVKTPKNWIWLRLAEQYLNLAEARYMTGDEDAAREALNVIRERAKMPDVTASGAELLDKIRNERRIELAFEEHRYYDVRRWKLGEQYLTKTVTGVTILKLPDGTKTYTPGKTVEERKFYTQMYWLPIPKSETDKNPRIIQNPGY